MRWRSVDDGRGRGGGGGGASGLLLKAYVPCVCVFGYEGKRMNMNYAIEKKSKKPNRQI